MEEVLDRAAIEAKRERLLDGLSNGKHRLEELKYKAAMSSDAADEQAMLDQQEAVRRDEMKLEGLDHGETLALAQEREQQAAERASERRAAGVRVLALVHERAWATEELDDAIRAVQRAIDKIDHQGGELALAASGWFDEDRGGQSAKNIFLMNVDALDMTDTVYRVRQAVSEDAGGYARSLAIGRAAALRALALAIPEVEDDAVRAEALALAQSAAKADERISAEAAPKRKVFSAVL